MMKGFGQFLLIISIFLLTMSIAFGETATYSSTFGAPLCTSGDYTSGTPCTTASLLIHRYTAESNYPNTVGSCTEQSGGYSTSTYTVEQLVAWDTDGDGQLETGDTIQVSYDGNCPEADDTYVGLWYSLNPELGTSATWTKIDSVDYDAGDFCDHGLSTYDETTNDGGFTGRTFTITGTPTYVAVRLANNGDTSLGGVSNGCQAGGYIDVDDLVLALYSPPSLPTTTSQSAVDIGKTNVTLTSTFTFEDATWIDSYFKIDGTPQTHTNSTTLTYHNRTFTGLDPETTYNYQICIVSDISAEHCRATSNFTTLDRTPPYINIASVFDINQTSATIGGTFFFEDFTNITAYAVLDGVNQTETLYASGVSQYHSEVITGLDHNTFYTWDYCISYSEGILCDGGGNFTTDDYSPPSINVINAFDITNHEATLGTTVLYNDYTSMTLSWYLDGELVDAQNWEQEDEYDTSVYYTYNLTELDYNTSYDYELLVSYISEDYTYQNVTTCASPLTQNYDCNGVLVALWSGSTVNEAQCLTMGNNWESYISIPASVPSGFTPSCVEVDNGYCRVTDGTKYNSGDGSSWASNCTTSEISTGTYTQFNSSSTFTTLDAYIPYITISGVIDVTGTTATLTGTYYYEDYSSTVPFFRLDGIDLLPKNNLSSPSEPVTHTYDLTGLTTNTTYNATFCVGYGLGWALLVCDDIGEFTTGFEPSVTFGTPNPVNKNDVTLHWTIDFEGTTNVSYQFLGEGAFVTAYDGVADTWLWSSLTSETEYPYFLTIKYDTLGSTYYVNTTTQYVTTYYENAFDDVWDTLLQGSSFGKILLGFVVLLGVIFLGVGAFGKYNIQISMIAVLIFTVVGTVLAGLMKLFPISIVLLVIAGSVVLMVLKNMFMGGSNDR